MVDEHVLPDLEAERCRYWVGKRGLEPTCETIEDGGAQLGGGEHDRSLHSPRLDFHRLTRCSAGVTSLRPNLVKRIDRLPKPTSVAAAMQPLFEAISNAIHSVQNKFGESVTTEGRVFVTVNTNRKKEGVWATVEDNGLGLDDRNWDAFTTTDTDNKLGIGGKGVGRLLWLDCFQKIDV